MKKTKVVRFSCNHNCGGAVRLCGDAKLKPALSGWRTLLGGADHRLCGVGDFAEDRRIYHPAQQLFLLGQGKISQGPGHHHRRSLVIIAVVLVVCSVFFQWKAYRDQLGRAADQNI